jgi:hypothetical protein
VLIVNMYFAPVCGACLFVFCATPLFSQYASSGSAGDTQQEVARQREEVNRQLALLEQERRRLQAEQQRYQALLTEGPALVHESLPEEWGGRPKGNSRSAQTRQQQWDEGRSRAIEEQLIRRGDYEGAAAYRQERQSAKDRQQLLQNLQAIQSQQQNLQFQMQQLQSQLYMLQSR